MKTYYNKVSDKETLHSILYCLCKRSSAFIPRSGHAGKSNGEGDRTLIGFKEKTIGGNDPGSIRVEVFAKREIKTVIQKLCRLPLLSAEAMDDPGLYRV